MSILRDINILDCELKNQLKLASNSSSKLRAAKCLHSHGDYHNRAFNYLLKGTYMQPHLHPEPFNIEGIYLLEGSLTMFFFKENGEICSTIELSPAKQEVIYVPSMTYHTYVINTDYAITYEVMDGIYTPSSWKNFPEWCPKENDSSIAVKNYMRSLENHLNF